MPSTRGLVFRILFSLMLFLAVLNVHAQTGNAGTIRGIVTDSTGAVVPNATVHLVNEVSQLDRTVISDSSGQFTFSNVPFNPYHLTVSAKGFAPFVQDVDLRSAVGTNLKLVLQVTGGTSTVTVEANGGDLIESVFRAQLAGNAVVPRCSGRFQRTLSRPGRPCFELLQH